jgi:hypothetical protein
MVNIVQQLNSFATSPALKELRGILDEFNSFEAIGITHQEIRHSAFLAFLLSPKANHGLGDRFLKSLLRSVEPAYLTVEDADFSDTEVRRQWKNIDLIAVTRARKLVLLIENKVFIADPRIAGGYL